MSDTKAGKNIPGGLGEELEAFCLEHALTNGLAGTKAANGAGCLAAWIVAHLKGNNPGNVYLMAGSTKAKDCGAEYEYSVNVPGTEEINAARGKATLHASVVCHKVHS